MSKAVKQITIILIVLLVGCMAFAFFSLMGKKKAEETVVALRSELSDAQKNVDSLLQKNQASRNELRQVLDEKTKLKERLSKAEAQVADLLSKISDIKRDKEKWQKMADELKAKRNELLAKIEELKNQPPKIKIVYREKKPKKNPAKADKPDMNKQLSPQIKKSPAENSSVSSAMAGVPTTIVKRPSDEEYWASVLKDKAALEVEIAKLKEQLSAGSLEVIEIKQKNKSLELEIASLKHDKDELEKEIEFKTEMITNLSVALARAKNDKKFISARVDKLNDENVKMRDELKKLVKTNGALEKMIVKIKQDKRRIEAQLGQTEDLIQSKIDEIWDLKESIDRSFRKSLQDSKNASSSSVELAPIVVSSSPSVAAASKKGGAFVAERPVSTGLNGKVLSVNEPNNFVIINLGENDGIHLGDRLSVYRDGKYIARIEVIQVRPDICAADLKDQWTRVKSGDQVM